MLAKVRVGAPSDYRSGAKVLGAYKLFLEGALVAAGPGRTDEAMKSVNAT